MMLESYTKRAADSFVLLFGMHSRPAAVSDCQISASLSDSLFEYFEAKTGLGDTPHATSELSPSD